MNKYTRAGSVYERAADFTVSRSIIAFALPSGDTPLFGWVTLTMGALMAGRTIQRRIYFFRTRVSPKEDGTIPKFPVAALGSAIGGLKFLDNFSPASRYMQDDEDGQLTCIWPVAGKTLATRFTIGTVRRIGLPSLERMGKIKPMRARKGVGVLEQTHVVFFQSGIVGAEFNFFGPRLSRLSQYIHEKLPRWPRVKFDPLLNHDAVTKLNELGSVRLVRLRMRRSDLALASQANKSLHDSLEATADKLGASVVEIMFQAEPLKRDSSLKQAVKTLLKNIVGRPTLLSQADLLRARGTNSETDKVEWFDFLKDKFVYSRQVSSLGGRAVNSNSMYQAIERAYDEHKHELADAAGVG